MAAQALDPDGDPVAETAAVTVHAGRAVGLL